MHRAQDCRCWAQRRGRDGSIHQGSERAGSYQPLRSRQRRSLGCCCCCGGQRTRRSAPLTLPVGTWLGPGTKPPRLRLRLLRGVSMPEEPGGGCSRSESGQRKDTASERKAGRQGKAAYDYLTGVRRSAESSKFAQPGETSYRALLLLPVGQSRRRRRLLLPSPARLQRRGLCGYFQVSQPGGGLKGRRRAASERAAEPPQPYLRLLLPLPPGGSRPPRVSMFPLPGALYSPGKGGISPPLLLLPRRRPRFLGRPLSRHVPALFPPKRRPLLTLKPRPQTTWSRPRPHAVLLLVLLKRPCRVKRGEGSGQARVECRRGLAQAVEGAHSNIYARSH